jgi:2-C-methyl-D-erythritol 2,4-cyclodiphosphate synthase
MNTLKIGHGFDIHPLVEGRPCIIGGVHIPFDKGLQGHSDADVLLHAICDALIGAMGLGDIGQLFPDNDQKYKDINSRVLLQEVYQKMQELKYTVSNIDATIICEAPKILNFSNQMKVNISTDLMCSVNDINIKAKTMEKLGAIGRGEGIAVEVVCLIGTTSQAK